MKDDKNREIFYFLVKWLRYQKEEEEKLEILITITHTYYVL